MAAKNERRVPLRNHHPLPIPAGYERVRANKRESAEITVVVHPRGSQAEWRALVARATSGLPAERTYLTRAEFGKSWGAAAEDLKAVSSFGARYGLETVLAEPWRRCVVLSGTLAQLERAFDVEFHEVDGPLGRFRWHRGAPQVDASVASVVEAVLGLSDFPISRPHVAVAAADGPTGLNLGELRRLYNFPPRFRGSGQCVAIIETGGGLRRSDYDRYFERIGIAPPALQIRLIGTAKNERAPKPAIEAFAEAMRNRKFPPNISEEMLILAEWSAEVAMDVETVGTLAPEAKILLVLTPNNDQGEYHALTSVLADTRNAPSVVSASWSSVEPQAKKQRQPLLTLNRWLEAAAVLGVTTCFASGDNGDGTLTETRKPLTFTANFPASSPYALACGGTTLDVHKGTETAWLQNVGIVGASGGGFSRVFDLPAWQTAAGIDSADWIPLGASSGTGRGLPDVSAKADYEPNFCFLLAGIAVEAGGTSASTPLWAALIAVLNEALNHRVGCINPLLYDGGLHEALRDIVRGRTGHLHAKRGWDPSTGWGSPDGEALLAALRATS